MDTPRSAPARATRTAPPRDPAAVNHLARALARALAAIDRDTVPRDPLARELHLAVAEFARLGVGEPANVRFAEALAPLYRVLDALDGTLVEDAAPQVLAEFVTGVDGATSLLEAPDLGAVPTDQLAGRFRELFGGIVRLRGTSARLHRAWSSSMSTGAVDR